MSPRSARCQHDWYRNPVTGVAQPVPRHREIKEFLARRILRMLADGAEETRPDGESGEAAAPDDPGS